MKALSFWFNKISIHTVSYTRHSSLILTCLAKRKWKAFIWVRSLQFALVFQGFIVCDAEQNLTMCNMNQLSVAYLFISSVSFFILQVSAFSSHYSLKCVCDALPYIIVSLEPLLKEIRESLDVKTLEINGTYYNIYIYIANDIILIILKLLKRLRNLFRIND